MSLNLPEQRHPLSLPLNHESINVHLLFLIISYLSRLFPIHISAKMSNQSVRSRLDAIISEKGEDYSSISRLIGRNPAYIQQFIKRGIPRKLAEEDRKRIAQYLNIPEQELGGPDTLAAAQNTAHASFTLIPRIDIGASAGPGTLAENDLYADSLAFRKSWLKRATSGAISDLSVIRVSGDSMFPTLSDGDDILVDRSDAAHRLRDGIYVLRLDGALMVKRLACNPTGQDFTIISDNSSYPSWTGIDPATVSVIGRVIWMGRRIG